MSIGAVAAALLMAIIGGLAWFQWGEAARERDNATNAEVRVTAQKRRADSELAKTQITQSHSWPVQRVNSAPPAMPERPKIRI